MHLDADVKNICNEKEYLCYVVAIMNSIAQKKKHTKIHTETHTPT